MVVASSVDGFAASNRSWVVFFDGTVAHGAKKSFCFSNHQTIDKIGVVRISPEIYQILMAGLVK